MYLKLERCPLQIVINDKVIMTTGQCRQVHRYLITKPQAWIPGIPVLTACLINDLHIELPVDITQEPDLEQPAVRIRIDPDRPGKGIVAL